MAVCHCISMLNVLRAALGAARRIVIIIVHIIIIIMILLCVTAFLS